MMMTTDSLVRTLRPVLLAGVLVVTAIVTAAPAHAQGTGKPQAPAAGTALPASARLDINSASEAELMQLKGIGEARARAIVKGRPYGGKDDLVKRKIVPQGVYDDIKDQIIARQK